ncbi:hypothetical protein N7507_009613 [Penicillium longicatenatum]|nr:hypothetical protein N7507_009613 [Penicillium longicatenatum]
MPTNLSILVFVASPLDYARYRHTALFFEFEPQAQAQKKYAADHTQMEPETEYIKSSVMEVIGSPGFMSFSERQNWGIPVSSTISGTIIRDGDGDTDWNCQNWVGDALGRLVKAGYLDSGARDHGLDAMIDVVMEAEDEEISVGGT